jgi:hypothetical protein
MPLKRRVAEDAYATALQDPRHMVNATLREPEPPAMEAYILRRQRLLRSRCNRVAKSSSLEPSVQRAVSNELTQGGGTGTYVMLDTSTGVGIGDRPTCCEARGDGASVVLSGRESRLHGEGRQVL